MVATFPRPDLPQGRPGLVGQIAQLVEHGTENAGVASSTLALPTSFPLPHSLRTRLAEVAGAASTRRAGVTPQPSPSRPISCREAELLARPGLTPQLRLLLLSPRALRHCHADGAIAALHRWAQVLGDVDRSELPIHGDDAVQLFGWYLRHVTEVDPDRLRVTLEVLLQRPETPVMSTATRLHAKGRVAALLRLLQKRFGPLPTNVEPRLAAATSEQLDRYLDRVLDAASLAEVLAD